MAATSFGVVKVCCVIGDITQYTDTRPVSPLPHVDLVKYLHNQLDIIGNRRNIDKCTILDPAVGHECELVETVRLRIGELSMLGFE